MFFIGFSCYSSIVTLGTHSGALWKLKSKAVWPLCLRTEVSVTQHQGGFPYWPTNVIIILVIINCYGVTVILTKSCQSAYSLANQKSHTFLYSKTVTSCPVVAAIHIHVHLWLSVPQKNTLKWFTKFIKTRLKSFGK